MDALKIPDLNLYRGKRGSKAGQYERIQAEGVDLLGKARNKQHLHEIQTQLYLDNYRANLQHFVSPSKYRDKADNYLKSSKYQSAINLKPIAFPQSRACCPRCYNRELTQQKQCYCQIQQRVSEQYHVKIDLGRRKEAAVFPAAIDPKQKKQNINAFPKKIEVVQQNEPEREHQEAQSSKKSSKRDIQISIRRYSSLQSLQLSISRPQIEEMNNYPRLQRQDNTRFLQELRNKEEYLNGIDMNTSGSQSSLHVDFNDLNLAKQDYVDKSQEFLDRLNRIIQMGQQPPNR